MTLRKHPKGYPPREVWERIDVPYDRDADGTPLTVRMDVLTCGHRLAARTAGVGHGKYAIQEHETRFCPKCPPEEKS